MECPYKWLSITKYTVAAYTYDCPKVLEHTGGKIMHIYFAQRGQQTFWDQQLHGEVTIIHNN